MSELRERELRDLLDRVSAIGGEVDVDEHWLAGRRRRTRRGTGIAVLTGLAVVAAVGAVAQTGLMGGSDDTPTGPAAVPDDLETFVFATQGTTGRPDQTQELHVPGVDDLAGTRWVLQRGMWHAPAAATDLTGTTAPTALTFGDATTGAGWGIDVAGCGLAQVPALQLDAHGRFPTNEPYSSDAGCAADVQTAEDFWRESLSGGGQLTLLGDGRWLLLSVQAPAQPTPAPTTGPQPTPSREPAEDGTPGPATTDGPQGSAPAPTTEPPSPAPTGGTAPTTAPTTPPGDAGAPPQEPSGAPFLDPGQESVDQPWPAGGGQLLAPTLRAGVHDGFDRVVVDLTGSGDLGWKASYTDDPRQDGSGLPVEVAGDSVLELRLSGMAYPEPGSDVYSEGTLTLGTPTLGAVVQVQRTTPFEGGLQVLVGIRGEPRPYRVFLLEDPMRLVVDVQTSP